MNIDHIRSITANHSPEFVKSDTAASLATFEAFRGEHNSRAKRLIVGGGVLKGSNIDISWLPAAAETYQISADPDDYVLVDVPIVTVDVPNRNMQAFPLEEVGYFDPVYGKQIYKTFIGKPSHIDHINQDPLKAKGVHFDASMEYIPAYGIFKIRVLTGWDRTKDPYLVKQIMSGARPGFSMGAMVSAFVCSVCGATDTNTNPCRHMDPRLGVSKGMLWDVMSDCRVMPNEVHGAAEMIKLIYQLCVGANYIEISNVGDPADPTADITGAHEPIWMP